jgi:hypothetical protein
MPPRCFDDLDATVTRLKGAGLRIVSGPHGHGLRSAFIEAPDTMELEIVDGNPAAPVLVP